MHVKHYGMAILKVRKIGIYVKHYGMCDKQNPADRMYIRFMKFHTWCVCYRTNRTYNIPNTVMFAYLAAFSAACEHAP